MEATAKYVSEAIGSTYKSWKPGDSVLICTQTGTGKTTFILKHLLSYAGSNDKYILFLVNRSALEEQVRNDIREKYNQYSEFIDVHTYQYYENSQISEYDYYVMDEAHYFINDASFNGNTCVTCKSMPYFLQKTVRTKERLQQKRKHTMI